MSRFTSPLSFGAVLCAALGIGAACWSVAAVTTSNLVSYPAGTILPMRSVSPPVFAPVQSAEPVVSPVEGRTDLSTEIGLQETLDRLGYTVNVPTDYAGHHLFTWNDYRHSTGDDTLPATSFRSRKSAHFTKLCEQAMFAGSMAFGARDSQGDSQILLKPDGSGYAMWLDPSCEQEVSAKLNGSVQFTLEDTTHRLCSTPYSSAPNVNADGNAHLIVLPARTGGHWVEEGNNAGHWEGGTDTGGYLLCWEDYTDYDYQDMIILADNIETEKAAR